MKVSEALKYVREVLSKIEDKEYARWEALLIISHLLNISPLNVYLYSDKEIPEKSFLEILEERKKKKPLAYILKNTYFWGRKFYVEEGVLIPRQDTEVLISVFLKLPIEKGRVLELGVGAGTISITLLLERKKLKVFAVDINPKAIEITRKNAKAYKVEKRLFLIKGDWFNPFLEKPLFNVIVSNPPYISSEEWETLDEEVKLFEPKSALVSGKEGTEFQEKLLKFADKYLLEGGFLIFEMGYNQGKRIRELLNLYQWKFEIFKDLRGYERVVLAWKEKENT
ncbi:MAG: peptide chain release factor N(5)-glutamine methyltransferase [Thermodesulfobacterium geofontis]|uniref:Release factor glutamine methyltransferase n=1 Tax=Thermodesulfobacterium geofontis TaxID=1295609 RepID=A0A2N7QGT3_9BACT|nr:MAG: peptide chain release factor N(5)-glutamine methyltransferase [Thermodesulfobacterium geofontis]PMP98184.1 MAG: peptide chain release factor N(5)-glutamine methyltransferase [Thermodesulfobacterium geofontis]